MATVLHISDIHRTKDERSSNAEILHALFADLDSYEAAGISKPDILVVSGDLSQSAEPAEYAEAEEFLRKLLHKANIPVERLILVPGNHDVHWPTSEDAFRLRRQTAPDLDPDLVIAHHGEFLCARSPEEYQRRLDNFRAFYAQLKGAPYPIERDRQYSIHEFPELGCAMACFSSCDLNDHRRFHGRIHVSAIASAAEALGSFDGVKVAVWHHDLNWRGITTIHDSLDYDSVRQLSMRSFQIGLCGHTHRPASHNVCTVDGLALPVISSGSLCAGPRERGDSVPRAYNVIECFEHFARIHVRTKEERSSPWTGVARFTDSNHRTVPWFEVAYATRPTSAVDGVSRQSPGSTERPRRLTDAKAPTPFGESNAKTMPRSDVVSQYVWTDVASRLDTDSPQIVLGPRGSGKTALLLSLTLEGRQAAGMRSTPNSVLRRIGLMCPMNIAETTAFNGKGWLKREERDGVFVGCLATMWAQEVVAALEKIGPIAESAKLTLPSQNELSGLLSVLWFGSKAHQSLASLRTWIKSLRSSLIAALGIRSQARRLKALSDLAQHPLARGGPGLLADAAGELRQWDALSTTRWIILFDEVEYLSEWQQQGVYSYLSHSSDLVSAKIATLPYAHARALRRGGLSLVKGNDYTELPLTLMANLELDQLEEEGTPKKFADIARGVWSARLETAGARNYTLEELWPEAGYEDVVADELNIERGDARRRLEQRLLGQFTPATRARAEELLPDRRPSFLDRYWRRYQQPFRFRAAREFEKEGVTLPLYWGWRLMLRACDGNCRWFLQLADECWRRYWSREGFRPLTPREQDEVLVHWATGVYRVCGTLTDRGVELQQVLDGVAGELRGRLYGNRFLVEEALTVNVKHLTPKQAEAVAIGVAFGFVVPRLRPEDDSPFSYPTDNVELRLGFPVAVAKELPLRQGATLHIRDLRQVVFPWLRE